MLKTLLLELQLLLKGESKPNICQKYGKFVSNIRHGRRIHMGSGTSIEVRMGINKFFDIRQQILIDFSLTPCLKHREKFTTQLKEADTLCRTQVLSPKEKMSDLHPHAAGMITTEWHCAIRFRCQRNVLLCDALQCPGRISH